MARRLVDESDRENARVVDAELTETGDLVISGSDWGPLVRDFFGRDEYEFTFTIRRADVQAFAETAGLDPTQVLDDLADRWSGSRFDELAALLRDDPATRGFPVDYWSF